MVDMYFHRGAVLCSLGHDWVAILEVTGLKSAGGCKWLYAKVYIIKPETWMGDCGDRGVCECMFICEWVRACSCVSGCVSAQVSVAGWNAELCILKLAYN